MSAVIFSIKIFFILFFEEGMRRKRYGRSKKKNFQVIFSVSYSTQGVSIW